MDVLLDIPPARILQVLRQTSELKAEVEGDPGVKVFAALLYSINYTADGLSKDFKWSRLPPFVGWASKKRFEYCQPRVRSALLQRFEIITNNKPDDTAIGKAFRRLPELKSDLTDYSSLDRATREAWTDACRDVLLDQPEGAVCDVSVQRNPSSDSDLEWWPRVVSIATNKLGHRRKRCPECRKRSIKSELLEPAELTNHLTNVHSPLAEAQAWVSDFEFDGAVNCPLCPTKFDSQSQLTDHLLSIHKHSLVFPSVHKVALAEVAGVSLPEQIPNPKLKEISAMRKTVRNAFRRTDPEAYREWETWRQESDHYVQVLVKKKSTCVTAKRELEEPEPQPSPCTKRRIETEG